MAVNENNYRHHPPTGGKDLKHESVRLACFVLAKHLETVCPVGRELSLSLTKVEEAMMWANAAIARNQEVGSPEPTQPPPAPGRKRDEPMM